MIMSAEFFRKYIDIVDESQRGTIYDPVDRTHRQPDSPEERALIAKGLKAGRRYNQDVAKYNAAQAPNEVHGYATSTAPPAPPEKIRGARSGMIRVPGDDGDVWQPIQGATKLVGAPFGKSPNTGGMFYDGDTYLQTRAIDTNKISPADIKGDIRANAGKKPKIIKPERPW